jgi:xylulokinase
MGLMEGTPVCAGGVDCGVASLGLGVFESGSYAVSIGTSMCAALVHDRPIHGKGLIEWPYVKDAKRLTYSFGGSSTAGALIKWFRDNFAELEKKTEETGGITAYQALDKQAEKISPGSDGLIILPYFMGERNPLWDTDAKGTIFGLSLMHTKAHIYRAFLEAVAYSLRHSIECTGEDLGDTILLAGGVAKSKVWRQIFADVTGYAVVCPLNDVEANLGDVILAGIGTGLLTYDDMKKWQTLGEKVIPNKEIHEKYNEYYKLYHEIYKDLKTDMKKLTEIR